MIKKLLALQDLLAKVRVQCRALDGYEGPEELLKIIRWCLPQAERELKKVLEIGGDPESE